MREAVLSGMGIAHLPTWMMTEPEKSKQVERLFASRSEAPTSIFAIVASTRELNAKQRAYIEFLRAKFEKIESLSPR
jgi:DNA-binding transcriptional LysR family regulator